MIGNPAGILIEVMADTVEEIMIAGAETVTGTMITTVTMAENAKGRGRGREIVLAALTRGVTRDLDLSQEITIVRGK